jgi:nicotinamidase-related amidase
MDVQRGVVERFAGAGELQSRLARAVDTARGAAVPLIFVRVAFRAGHPEVSVNNRSFSALASQAGTRFTDDSEATQIHPAVGPLDGDLVVVKKRVSAFSGSDLEVLLRSLDVTHLVLTGIATSGVVLSTLREAADKDYRLPFWPTAASMSTRRCTGCSLRKCSPVRPRWSRSTSGPAV